MAIDVTNTPLTLGRGQILLARSPAAGILATRGFRYIGNTPGFSINFEESKLDHYSSDQGIKEKDESITIEVNRAGSLETDRVSPSNLALFFLGSASALTQVSALAIVENFEDEVEIGAFLQLGKSSLNITGARGVDVTTVTNTGAVVTYTEGVDYAVHANQGMIEILPTTTMTELAEIIVTYDLVAETRNRIISGNMPRVRLSANGDFTLKSDEWQTLPFSIEILKLAQYEAVYVDGEPYTP